MQQTPHLASAMLTLAFAAIMHFAKITEKRMGLTVSVCVGFLGSHLDLQSPLRDEATNIAVHSTTGI